MLGTVRWEVATGGSTVYVPWWVVLIVAALFTILLTRRESVLADLLERVSELEAKIEKLESKVPDDNEVSLE